MDRLQVAVLGGLNEKDHQKGDDGGSGVYDQLPGVGIIEIGTRHSPREDDGRSKEKSPRRAHRAGGVPCKLSQNLPHAAPTVACTVKRQLSCEVPADAAPSEQSPSRQGGSYATRRNCLRPKCGRCRVLSLVVRHHRYR